MINSRPGERVIAREAPEIVPAMEAELERLGRSMSARSAAINEHEQTERDPAEREPVA